MKFTTVSSDDSRVAQTHIDKPTSNKVNKTCCHCCSLSSANSLKPHRSESSMNALYVIEGTFAVHHNLLSACCA